MTDHACGLCNDRQKYPDSVVIRGCPVHDPPKWSDLFGIDPTFTHDHIWSAWQDRDWPGFFRVCLHPNCAAREDRDACHPSESVGGTSKTPTE